MLIDASGSAWVEYKKSGTMHGMKMPEGMVESQKLPEPVFTPSTKAELGEHDENIHPDKGELGLLDGMNANSDFSQGYLWRGDCRGHCSYRRPALL